jgi:glutathione S-transferase
MLKLYGHGTSQPTRAVMWVLKMKQLPHELVKVDPMTGFDAAFKAKFPQALIPCIEDGPDVQIGESHAILTYLATKHRWNDLYPFDSLPQRARIDEYLHWHHNNTRLLSGTLFRPFLFTVLLKGQLPNAPKESDLKRLDRAMATLDAWLATSPFLARSSHATIADISAYSEFDQILALADRGRKLYDFSRFTNIQAWLARMRALPFHDDVRRTLNKTCDLACEKAATVAKL